MALMPQTAGTPFSSQNIAPFRLPSKASELVIEGALLITSLRKITSPNRRVVEFGLASFVVISSALSSSEVERTLYAFFTGSATRQPAILWESTNRYTCNQSKSSLGTIENLSVGFGIMNMK